MTLQFINMEVMKLIIYPKSWKHQILFNSFIFGIALRNKHFKVNIFSESSLCGLIRVLQTTTGFFSSSSQHISFLLLMSWFGCFYWGVLWWFFFFLHHAFSHPTFTFSHISGYVCTAHLCFSFKHSEGKNQPKKHQLLN